VKLNEADRSAEKVLGLPVRSRFGEGRAKPLIDLIRTSEALERSLFNEWESCPKHFKRSHPLKGNSKTFEVGLPAAGRSICSLYHFMPQ